MGETALPRFDRQARRLVRGQSGFGRPAGPGGGRLSLVAVDAVRPPRVAHPQRLLLRSPGARHRSEEHTSELQSLMRISYAVFCLKKKTQSHTTKSYITTTYSVMRSDLKG